MSGIAGIFSRSERPVQRNLLAAMLSVLVHRGPDGADIWTTDKVGMVHRMLYTTPESIHERQPLVELNAAITADARIDNREELVRILGLDPRSLSTITDSQLILAAYRKWGKDCPSRLLGDFAFAIWDASRQLIFCARDPFGVKPFYYSLGSHAFIFGSEIKAILCSDEAPKRLNEAWMAKFLIPSNNLLDKESTFYADIFRLTPAHSITVTSSSHVVDCYWKLDPERETRFASEDEYAEAMREQFTLAVRRRLRSAYPVGSTLSGGLDSSSIACTARDLLVADQQPALHTFSAVFTDSPEADESPYINAVIDQGNLQTHILHPDQSSPFVDLERILWHLDEPFYGTNYFMPWSFYQSAQNLGVRVLMDGTDGDTTISHGMDHLDILARQSNWQQFANEANAVTKNFDHPRYASTHMILFSYGTPRLTELARKGKWVAFIKGVREISQLFHVSPERLVLNWGIKPLLPDAVYQSLLSMRGRGSKKGKPSFPAHVSTEFIQRLTTQAYFQNTPSPAKMIEQNGRALHYHYLSLGMLPYSLEMINRMASACSVEVRFPFCDRDLVEFSLSIPPEMKLKDGWSRYIMRKAMTGILPEKVQWRGGKISLTRVYPFMLRKYAQDYVSELLANPPAMLDGYIDISAVRKMYRSFIQEKNTNGLEWVWQTIIFSVWMRQAGCITE